MVHILVAIILVILATGNSVVLLKSLATSRETTTTRITNHHEQGLDRPALAPGRLFVCGYPIDGFAKNVFSDYTFSGRFSVKIESQTNDVIAWGGAECGDFIGNYRDFVLYAIGHFKGRVLFLDGCRKVPMIMVP